MIPISFSSLSSFPQQIPTCEKHLTKHRRGASKEHHCPNGAMGVASPKVAIFIYFHRENLGKYHDIP
jgi:hypothetical protein